MELYRPGLPALPTYDIEDGCWDIKVDANESNYNLPPLVRERLINCLADVAFHRYPGATTGLQAQIAQDFGVTADSILLGNGSSELLEKLFYAYGGPGRSIVFPVPSFSMYAIYAKLSESTAVPVALEDDYSLHPDKVLAAARQSSARLIVLCTPNNPTGNVMSLHDIETIVSQASCPVVVDEAYVEFYGCSAAGLLHKYSNVMIARTFSKAYAFAAARMGYLVAAADTIAMLGKVCMPYHINALSLAGAEIVYQMRHEFEPVIAQTVAERIRLMAGLQALPQVMTVFPSEANFLLVKFSQAAQIAQLLADHSILVRDFSNAPRLENCLRITVGRPDENETMLNILTAAAAKGANI